MTSNENLPETISPEPLSVLWHPEALRPPFEWNVQLPADWAVLETHPSRWKRQNERIVDDYFGGQRVASKVRNGLLRALADAVAAAQQKKVLLTLIKPGIDTEGRIANVAMNFVFTSSSPRLASMAPIKRAFASNDSYAEHTTPHGAAYATLTSQRTQRDGTEHRELLSVQGFLPFASTTWTLAIGVTTPQVDLAEQLHNMVVRCVSSVRANPDSTQQDDGAVTNGDITDIPDLNDAIELINRTVKP